MGDPLANNAELADFPDVYSSELEDILRRKNQIRTDKQNELDALKKKGAADREIEKITEHIKRIDSEIKLIDEGRKSTRPKAKSGLVGLALSGGGIRSATFNLGLMQSLCNKEILERVDYLSTVSGGGYIGSCLTTLLNSESDVGLTKGNFPLGIHMSADTDQPTREKEPVRRLRYFSNYLTAEGSFWNKYFRPAMVFLKGLILNLSLLVPYLIAFALAMSIVFNLKFFLPMVQSNPIFFDIQEFRAAVEANDKAKRKQAELKAFLLKPTADLGIADEATRIDIAKNLARSEKKYAHLTKRIEAYTTLEKEVSAAKDSLWWEWFTILIIPATFLALLILIALFQRSNYNEDFETRLKFSNRLTSLLVLAIGVLCIELYGVLIVHWENWDIPPLVTSVSFIFLLAPRLLKSADANKAKGKNPWLQIVIAIGLLTLAPLFLLFLTGAAISRVTNPQYALATGSALIISFLVFFVVNRKFINLNEISLHNFYRDRLSRAYLFKYYPGSQPPIRHCDDITLSELKPEKGPYHIFNTVLNLTKKMPAYKMDMKKGENQAPGKAAADDEIFRNGESFMLTKNWCGSEKTRYCPTPIYEKADEHINVGTAVAISGAAANIGMAHKNIPAVRLLMGLLNIRLGYWALHPNMATRESGKSFWRAFPGSVEALREWFGIYSLDSRYINLSDGGHFDNIGVYELLRRRCKYIIVGDAEADTEMKFEAISYIMRLARIDFGIEIKIDTSDIKPDPASGYSRNHCVVGRIEYPEGDFGYLLYCKASLTGDEPEHLHEYKVKHPQFPHQTTADQWFDEQQFEAYRELGYHVGKLAFKPLTSIAKLDHEELFNLLKEFWYPHSQAVEAEFTRHAVELNRIVMEIKNDEDFKFMDYHIYPEWERLVQKKENTSSKAKSDPEADHAPAINFWLPSDSRQIRKGFYLCNLMMQLMENVYTDLNLETEHNHPDNRGWMNLFRHWSWSGMFRVAWTISACTFGARFQKFCEKHLDLELGDLEVKKHETIGSAVAKELNPYEREIIKNFKNDNGYCFNSVYVFELKVSDPTDKRRHKTFHFGFALVNSKNQIVFFRVQDHLRKMGLARRALKKLVASEEINTFCTKDIEEALEKKRKTDAIPLAEENIIRFARLCNQLGIVTETRC